MGRAWLSGWRLDGHVVPPAGENVGPGGPPGALVVGRWPVGVVEDGFDDAPLFLDGVFAGETVPAAVHGVVQESFVGLLAVPESGGEVDIEVNGLADGVRAGSEANQMCGLRYTKVA